MVAPVALAILFKSSCCSERQKIKRTEDHTFVTLLTAIQPFSTKYFNERSSIPFVVRRTFAPLLRMSEIC